MNTNNGGEEGRGERDEQDQGDDALGGPVVDAAGAAEEPVEAGLDGVEEEEHVADAGEEDPEGGEAGAGVDEGDAEGEEDPAWDEVSSVGLAQGVGGGSASRTHDVVRYTGGEGDDSDGCVEELQLGQDTAEDGEGLDGA